MFPKSEIGEQLVPTIKLLHPEDSRVRVGNCFACCSFPDEPIDTSDHEEAAKAGRGKGIVVSIIDILLCAVAIKRQWAIFTTERDLTNYMKVLPISIHAVRK